MKRVLMGTLLFQVKSVSVIVGAGSASCSRVRIVAMVPYGITSTSRCSSVTAVFLLVFVVQLLITASRDDGSEYLPTEPLHATGHTDRMEVSQYLSYPRHAATRLAHRRSLMKRSRSRNREGLIPVESSGVTRRGSFLAAPAYIDWAARPVAIMIEARGRRVDPRRSSSHAFGYLLMVGGFAAPAVPCGSPASAGVLRERALARTGSRRAATERSSNAARIFILAFLFRSRRFVISPGSPPLRCSASTSERHGSGDRRRRRSWGVSSAAGGNLPDLRVAATTIAMPTPVVRVADGSACCVAASTCGPRPPHDVHLLPWAGFFPGAPECPPS